MGLFEKRKKQDWDIPARLDIHTRGPEAYSIETGRLTAFEKKIDEMVRQFIKANNYDAANGDVLDNMIRAEAQHHIEALHQQYGRNLYVLQLLNGCREGDVQALHSRLEQERAALERITEELEWLRELSRKEKRGDSDV